MKRAKLFFRDLLRASEQVPIFIAAILIIFSFDLIMWATNGEGAVYQIPVAQAMLIAALVVLSGMTFARWVIKWQWKVLDNYLRCEIDWKKSEINENVFTCIAILFTLFLVWVYCSVVVALIT